MKRLQLAVVMVGAAALAACVDLPPTAPAVVGDPQQNVTTAPGRARAVGLDAEFAQIAREAPGFGGMFYDERGRLNVYMTQSVQGAVAARQNVLARLERSLQARGGGLGGQEVVVLEGTRDFLELHELHEQLSTMFSIPGVVFTDIDEANNRLRLGVLEGVDVTHIEQALGMAGVPSEVVAIERTSPILPLNTVQDIQNPLGGGLQLVWQWPGTSSFFLCTLGFNATRGGPGRSEMFFFTNSHCTGDMGIVQGTRYHQPLPAQFGAGRLVGVEVEDPPPFPCFGTFVCRLSDAALVAYERNVPVKQGAIYRTLGFGTGNAPGSLVVEDVDRKMFAIVGDVPFPLVGEVLDKVGRTTGWTRGPVIITCGNFLGAGSAIVMLCQDVVLASALGGDSGSPVFQQIGNTKNALLYGLVWGAGTLVGGAHVYIFSALENIGIDFGPFRTH